MRGVNGHLGTVFKIFLASIFHSEKLGSAQVQLGFSLGSAWVQRAEPKLNPTHELVCRELFLDFLTFWDRFRIIIASFFKVKEL